MSVGDFFIAGTQVGNNIKTRRERRRNTQKILSFVSLTRRVHKPDKTGAPSKMHPVAKIRGHRSASPKKIKNMLHIIDGSAY